MNKFVSIMFNVLRFENVCMAILVLAVFLPPTMFNWTIHWSCVMGLCILRMLKHSSWHAAVIHICQSAGVEKFEIRQMVADKFYPGHINAIIARHRRMIDSTGLPWPAMPQRT